MPALLMQHIHLGVATLIKAPRKTPTSVWPGNVLYRKPLIER
jgi:hypothetical protein